MSSLAFLFTFLIFSSAEAQSPSPEARQELQNLMTECSVSLTQMELWTPESPWVSRVEDLSASDQDLVDHEVQQLAATVRAYQKWESSRMLEDHAEAQDLLELIQLRVLSLRSRHPDLQSGSPQHLPAVHRKWLRIAAELIAQAGQQTQNEAAGLLAEDIERFRGKTTFGRWRKVFAATYVTPFYQRNDVIYHLLLNFLERETAFLEQHPSRAVEAAIQDLMEEEGSPLEVYSGPIPNDPAFHREFHFPVPRGTRSLSELQSKLKRKRGALLLALRESFLEDPDQALYSMDEAKDLVAASTREIRDQENHLALQALLEARMNLRQEQDEDLQRRRAEKRVKRAERKAEAEAVEAKRGSLAPWMADLPKLLALRAALFQIKGDRINIAPVVASWTDQRGHPFELAAEGPLTATNNNDDLFEEISFRLRKFGEQPDQWIRSRDRIQPEIFAQQLSQSMGTEWRIRDIPQISTVADRLHHDQHTTPDDLHQAFAVGDDGPMSYRDLLEFAKRISVEAWLRYTGAFSVNKSEVVRYSW